MEKIAEREKKQWRHIETMMKTNDSQDKPILRIGDIEVEREEIKKAVEDFWKDRYGMEGCQK